MARGYQGERGDVTALPMKKWFTTNYHYLVPEFDSSTEVRLNGTNRSMSTWRRSRWA